MAQTAQNPITQTAPTIDGRLGSPAWQHAYHIGDFKKMKLGYGVPPSQESAEFMVYDLEKVYLGFHCLDSEPGKIKASVARCDNPGNDDRIGFSLDSFKDKLRAYFWLANPLGIQSHGTLNADTSPDETLDVIWESAGQVDGRR